MIAVFIVVAVVIAYARDRAKAPFVDCRCRGGRVVSSWRSDAWGPHRACEGRGSRARRL